MQVEKVVNKAYGMLAFICGCIEFKNWQKDVAALERVQKGFTRMLPGMESISNEESLEKLGLFSLEQQSLRGDLIQVYKIMKGMDKVDSQKHFPRVEESDGNRGIRSPEGKRVLVVTGSMLGFPVLFILSWGVGVAGKISSCYLSLVAPMLMHQANGVALRTFDSDKYDRSIAVGTCMGPSYACLFVGYVEQSLF
eukprot:g28112.t1